MGKIQIRKTPKRRVRNPDSGEELAEDKVYLVEDSIFWRRRLQSRDVTLASEKEKTSPPAPKSEPAKKAAGKDAGETKVEVEPTKETTTAAPVPASDENAKEPEPAPKPESSKKSHAKAG